MIIALYVLLPILCVILDQVSKYFIYGQSFPLIGDFLWIESSFNTGAAFSLGEGAKWFFIVITIVASIVMIYLIASKKWGLSRFTKISICLILGGAIGNLIDRIWLGGVRDFIYLKSINFAIFNIADSFVTVGAVLLFISIIITIVKSKRKKDGTC